MLRKVLIANRGEIAIRIARTLRELSVASVAVFTDVDAEGLFLGSCDEAVALGESPRAYLDIERLVAAAKSRGCDGLHPGYGFLSENAELAEACERAGICFVGPPASAIRAMGNKQRARDLMQRAGVPIVPGGPAETLDEAQHSANAIGYPVLVKATDGGGGKGMRRVERVEELADAIERTRSEALSAFGSDRVHLEKAILRPRHVEIQVLGDRDGTIVPLYERDCSLQRRHQKILEETPCPALGAETLAEMSSVAVRGAQAIGYYSAGTFEFLLDAQGHFYFLEMNTRLQVEHPITEWVTGLDLVAEMLRIAVGEPGLAVAPERRGVAIEARVYAEDPRHGFLPSPGRIGELVEPAGPFVRVDSGVSAGSLVGPDYDPLLAKLSVWAPDRPAAIARLARALSEYRVLGVHTNLTFLSRLVSDPCFLRGDYDTEFVERSRELLQPPALAAERSADLVAALAALELGSPRKNAPKVPAREQPSPWLLAERARLR